MSCVSLANDSIFIFLLGMMSAAAALGLVLLWDLDGGLTQIDKYLYSPEDQIKVKIDYGYSERGSHNLCLLITVVLKAWHHNR